jgi:hypothetical protein
MGAGSKRTPAGDRVQAVRAKRRVHCSRRLQAGVERIAAEAKSKLVTSNFFNRRTLAGQGCEQSPYSDGEPDRGFGQIC